MSVLRYKSNEYWHRDEGRGRVPIYVVPPVFPVVDNSPYFTLWLRSVYSAVGSNGMYVSDKVDGVVDYTTSRGELYALSDQFLDTRYYFKTENGVNYFSYYLYGVFYPSNEDDTQAWEVCTFSNVIELNVQSEPRADDIYDTGGSDVTIYNNTGRTVDITVTADGTAGRFNLVSYEGTVNITTVVI